MPPTSPAHSWRPFVCSHCVTAVLKLTTASAAARLMTASKLSESSPTVSLRARRSKSLQDRARAWTSNMAADDAKA